MKKEDDWQEDFRSTFHRHYTLIEAVIIVISADLKINRDQVSAFLKYERDFLDLSAEDEIKIKAWIKKYKDIEQKKNKEINQSKESYVNRVINWVTGTFRVMLGYLRRP
jgi:hypothetical protein